MRLSSLAALVSAAAVSIAACSGRAPPPTQLLDGSTVETMPVELEGVPQPIRTQLRVVPASEIERDSRTGTCVRTRARGAHPTGHIVERVSVHEESVTLRDGSGLYACVDSAGPSVEGRRWCSGAFGRLYGGHLHDPRLDIGWCKTKDGDPLASAWVEPSASARYVVVKQPGYSEVYEVAAGLPVRISTVTGLESDPLGARFDVSEYDTLGMFLRHYELETRPAG